MAYTRAALRSFVSGLPPAAVRVAVVPFGSVHVERTIANGRFVTPEMASLQLEAIPAPSRSANTALYSAVQAGAALLARQQLRIRGSARRLLLLVTDGRNEVRPEVGDDKGLLTDDQLPLARTAAVQAGVEVIPFGVGVGVKRAQLDSLASPSGRAYISALEPLPIADELAAIRLRLSDYRRLTFASGADVATLGRIVRGDGLTVKVDGANGETIGLSWSPPLFALPVFEGTADTLATRGIGDEFALGLTALPVERLVYVMAVFLLLAVAWIVVPRWLWPPVAFEQSVVRERTEERLPSVSTVASAGGGLRSAREVPPRGPTQVTGEHPIAR
jgi:Ca-activated chloride channel family protein